MFPLLQFNQIAEWAKRHEIKWRRSKNHKRLATGIRPSTFESETRTDHGITYMFIRNVGVAHDCGAERPRGSIYGFAGRLISTDASLHKIHDCKLQYYKKVRILQIM